MANRCRDDLLYHGRSIAELLQMLKRSRRRTQRAGSCSCHCTISCSCYRGAIAPFSGIYNATDPARSDSLLTGRSTSNIGRAFTSAARNFPGSLAPGERSHPSVVLRMRPDSAHSAMMSMAHPRLTWATSMTRRSTWESSTFSFAKELPYLSITDRTDWWLGFKARRRQKDRQGCLPLLRFPGGPDRPVFPAIESPSYLSNR